MQSQIAVSFSAVLILFVCVWEKMTESLNSVLKRELFDATTLLFFFFFFARYLFPKTVKSA